MCKPQFQNSKHRRTAYSQATTGLPRMFTNTPEFHCHYNTCSKGTHMKIFIRLLQWSVTHQWPLTGAQDVIPRAVQLFIGVLEAVSRLFWSRDIWVTWAPWSAYQPTCVQVSAGHLKTTPSTTVSGGGQTRLVDPNKAACVFGGSFGMRLQVDAVQPQHLSRHCCGRRFLFW